MKLKAVYPGTFDPITFGHLDVIKRGKKLFDSLVVGVTTNPAKKPFFSLEERHKMVKQSVSGLKGIEVKKFDSLLVDFARQEHAKVILRGLREASDFSAEFSNAITNRKLAKEIETVFVMTNPSFFYISSSVVKEIAALGGNVRDFVPMPVQRLLAKKLKKQRFFQKR
ncbi:MAG: pantetheine-phosphate adenylyltransferase [Candidatus Diapherotrites archaeon]|nr:pantetheine-phosphate adenylyltransferase [Candidatus Diapherotrites archaeon]